MAINGKQENEHVKFISYTGRYPNLCRGILTLEIDGEKVRFGSGEKYTDFWRSGGGISRSYNAYSGEWDINISELPEQYQKYAIEIDKVFNANVPHGCCGGCI